MIEHPNEIPKNDAMLARARELRKEMTKQERHLWFDFLRNFRVKIYKQRIIESYIVDFYCPAAKLIIEVDGAQHYSEEGREYDKQRTECFEKYGLKVIRFTNREIDREFEGAALMIANEIDKRIKQLQG